MTELRQRMIADMTSAGLAPSTKAVYIQGVRALAAYYRRSPDQLCEAEVRCCICAMSVVWRTHVRVIGKGNKERRVPLPQPVLTELRRLWKMDRNKRWLCPSPRGSGPISRRRPWQDTLTMVDVATGLDRVPAARRP
jgi:integrase